MLAGSGRFESDYEQAVIYAILNEQRGPATSLRPGIPLELERITTKMLAKRPEDRYQHIEELLIDLRRLVHECGSTGAPGLRVSKRRLMESPQWKRPAFIFAGVLVAAALIAAVVWLVRNREKPSSVEKSIAVLPLSTLGEKEDDQSFADGIHGEILTRLTWIKEIKVKAQTSVLHYRDTRKTIRQIGQELGVSYLLEGRVQKAGGRVGI